MANVFYSGQSDINNSCQHLSKQENAQWDPLGVTSCELELRLDSVHSGYSCGKHIMVHPRLYPVFRPTVVLKQKPSSPVLTQTGLSGFSSYLLVVPAAACPVAGTRLKSLLRLRSFIFSLNSS